MPSYPHVLTEEQMQDVLEMSGIDYEIRNHYDTVQNQIVIKTKNGVFIREVSELESPIPYLFEEFTRLREKGYV